jgi:hypothetical protein
MSPETGGNPDDFITDETRLAVGMQHLDTAESSLNALQILFPDITPNLHLDLLGGTVEGFTDNAFAKAVADWNVSMQEINEHPDIHDTFRTTVDKNVSANRLLQELELPEAPDLFALSLRELHFLEARQDVEAKAWQDRLGAEEEMRYEKTFGTFVLPVWGIIDTVLMEQITPKSRASTEMPLGVIQTVVLATKHPLLRHNMSARVERTGKVVATHQLVFSPIPRIAPGWNEWNQSIINRKE